MYKIILVIAAITISLFGGVEYYQKAPVNKVKSEVIPGFHENYSMVSETIKSEFNQTFETIYKTISFFSGKEWPEQDARDKLSIEFNHIVNLYPFISGVLVLDDKGNYYTSSTIKKNGQVISQEQIAKTNFNLSQWYRDFQSQKTSNDLEKQLAGLKVGNVNKESSIFIEPNKEWILFGKELIKNSNKNKKIDYNIFFFTNTDWIQGLTSKSQEMLTLLGTNSNTRFNNKISEINDQYAYKAVMLNDNKITSGKNWEIHFATIPRMITVNHTQKVSPIPPLAYVGIGIISLLAIMGLGRGNRSDGFSSIEIGKLSKLTGEIGKIRKKYKAILQNLSKVNEKLQFVKEEILQNKQDAGMEQIESSLKTLSDKSTEQSIKNFIETLEGINASHESSVNALTKLENFTKTKEENDKMILDAIAKIKSFVGEYRVETLNLGLMSENNSSPELQFLTQDLYKISTNLQSEVNKVEAFYQKASDTYNKELTEALELVHENNGTLKESAEVKEFTIELQQVLEEQIQVGQQVREQLKTRKSQDAKLNSSFNKLTSSLSQSLELLDKEKRKLVSSEKEIGTMIHNIHGIRKRQEVTH